MASSTFYSRVLEMRGIVLLATLLSGMTMQAGAWWRKSPFTPRKTLPSSYLAYPSCRVEGEKCGVYKRCCDVSAHGRAYCG